MIHTIWWTDKKYFQRPFMKDCDKKTKVQGDWSIAKVLDVQTPKPWKKKDIAVCPVIPAPGDDEWREEDSEDLLATKTVRNKLSGPRVWERLWFKNKRWVKKEEGNPHWSWPPHGVWSLPSQAYTRIYTHTRTHQYTFIYEDKVFPLSASKMRGLRLM